MSTTLIVAPYSFATLAQLLAVLGREGPVALADQQLAADALSESYAELENITGRRLAARTYRNTTTFASATIGSDGKTVTVASGASALKPLDDVVCSLVVSGTRVDSVTNDTTFVLAAPDGGGTAGTAGTAAMTVGSAPLVLTPHATPSMYADFNHRPRGAVFSVRLPEEPVSAVWTINRVAPDGTKTALDLTGMQLTEETGRVTLTADQFWGGYRHEFECQAGYAQPSSTQLGHFADWMTLRRLQLRLAVIFYRDKANGLGRATQTAAGTAHASIPAFTLPADITSSLNSYMRRG